MNRCLCTIRPYNYCNLAQGSSQAAAANLLAWPASGWSYNACCIPLDNRAEHRMEANQESIFPL
jgi:hypothetical protein